MAPGPFRQMRPQSGVILTAAAIDVFREDGVFVGRLPVPETVTLTYQRGAHATPEYLLFAGADDAGTPYVTRLRIGR